MSEGVTACIALASFSRIFSSGLHERHRSWRFSNGVGLILYRSVMDEDTESFLSFFGTSSRRSRRRRLDASNK
jgi:hypothetical protein